MSTTWAFDINCCESARTVPVILPPFFPKTTSSLSEVGPVTIMLFVNTSPEPKRISFTYKFIALDSDGAWPFGTESSDHRRSDEICPGQTWTYTFDVTDEMVGAWPFHDHWRDIGSYVNRGLFGGLIVKPKDHPHRERLTLPK